eukprot:11995150-Alexandrium_andersonii.AAC.1
MRVTAARLSRRRQHSAEPVMRRLQTASQHLDAERHGRLHAQAAKEVIFLMHECPGVVQVLPWPVPSKHLVLIETIMQGTHV